MQACRDMVKEWDRRDASRRKALSQLQTKSPMPNASRLVLLLSIALIWIWREVKILHLVLHPVSRRRTWRRWSRSGWWRRNWWAKMTRKTFLSQRGRWISRWLWERIKSDLFLFLTTVILFQRSSEWNCQQSPPNVHFSGSSIKLGSGYVQGSPGEGQQGMWSILNSTTFGKSSFGHYNCDKLFCLGYRRTIEGASRCERNKIHGDGETPDGGILFCHCSDIRHFSFIFQKSTGSL